MDRRLVVALFFTALLLASQAAFSQPPGTSIPDIGLGYGPQSIVPLTSGSPVMSQGDALWAQSYESATSLTLILISPSGAASQFVNLPPGQLVNVYTFSQSDPAGNWTLDVYTGQAVDQVRLAVVSGSYPLTPTLSGAGLARDSLALRYSLPATPAYGIQACLMGAQEGPSSTLQLPPSVGGSLEVSLNDSSVAALAPSVTSPTPIWFELYTPRAVLNGTALISAEVQAASTQVFNLGVSPTAVSAPLAGALVFRDGRYDLRTFVRTPSGLASFDTPYLRNGTAWISLAGCSDLAQVTSGSFQLDAKLNGSAATWPRRLIMMYDVGGVESFGVSNVEAAEARVDLGNSSQASQLSKVGVSVEGTVTTAWDAYNGSVYLMASSFPLSFEVRLSFENVTTETFHVDIPEAFWIGSLQVPFGEVNVSAVSGGSSASNATVLVAPAGSPPAALRTDANGTASIVLPPGEYNFTLSLAGRSVSEVVQVEQGTTADARLDLGSGSPPVLLYLLAVVLVVGVGLDAVVWRAYLRRRAAFR